MSTDDRKPAADFQPPAEPRPAPAAETREEPAAERLSTQFEIRPAPDFAVQATIEQTPSMAEAVRREFDSRETVTARPALPDIPGYVIEAEIARGGNGVVYRARHLRLNRPAAIKMILGGKYHDPAARIRFLIEAEAVAALDHPHIVHVDEFGTHHDLPFFAMEFVAGGTLADRIKSAKPSAREAAELMVKLADAIAAAHAKGIVHRDLKPLNVLLTEAGEPKITDFGLAKVGHSDMTATGAVMGTASYMSSEQAAGRTKEVGTPTDVYALGAILYELLISFPPFLGESSMETIQHVLTKDVRPLRTIDPNIPRDLETICLKCLEKDAKKRYATASDLAADLQAFLDGRPIAARPVGTAERTWKWVKRNPAVTSALALAALALLAGSVVSAVFAVRAETARQAEQGRAQSEAQARGEADEARRAAKRQLLDLCAASGLEAARNNDHAQALLWFTKAATSAEGEPARERLNRIRVSNGLRHVWSPVKRFRVPNVGPDAVGIQRFETHPDGKHVLVLTSAGKLSCWDVDREVALVLPDLPPLSTTAFSPDGTRLAVLPKAGSVELLAFPGMGQRQQLGQVKAGKALAFSPDSRTLGWSDGRELCLYDVRDNQLHQPVPQPVPVSGLQFSVQGDRLVTLSDDAQARVLAIKSGSATLEYGPVPHKHSPRAVVLPQFINDGKLLLTVLDGRRVAWHDLQANKQLRVLVPSKGNSVTAIVPYEMGQRVALVWDFSVRVWDAADGRELGRSNKLELATDADIDPTGTELITAECNGTARILSLPDRKDPVMTSLRIPHPTAVPARTRFFPKGDRLATAQVDGWVLVWARPSGDPVAFRVPAEGNTRLTMTGDGRHFAPTSFSQMSSRLLSTGAYDSRTGEPAGPPLSPGGILTDAAFSPDGRLLATASSAGTTEAERDRLMFRPTDPNGGVQLWDWKTGKAICVPIQTPTEPRGLAFDPSGKVLAATCADGWAVVIEVESGKVLHRLDSKSRSRPYLPNLWTNNGAARFSPDGNRLATWEMTDRVQVWDPKTGQLLWDLKHVARPEDVAFDPSGTFLAITVFHFAHVWDLTTGKPAVAPLDQGQVAVAPLFSEDGRSLLVGCGNGVVNRWDWRAGRRTGANRSIKWATHDLVRSEDANWLVVPSGMGGTGLLAFPALDTVMPVLLPEMTAVSARPTPDNQRLIVAGFGGNIIGLDMGKLTSPLEDSAEDLTRAAELRAGSRIDDFGTLVELSPAEWRERWEKYRRR